MRRLNKIHLQKLKSIAKKATNTFESNVGLWTFLAVLISLIALITSLFFSYKANNATREQLKLSKAQFDSSLEQRRSDILKDDEENRQKEAIRLLEVRHQDTLNRLQFESASKVLDLQGKSVEAQINSLLETRSQFLYSNRPYVEITDITVNIDTLEQFVRNKSGENDDYFPEVKYGYTVKKTSYNILVETRISNSGKYPAKIVTGSYGFVIEEENFEKANIIEYYETDFLKGVNLNTGEYSNKMKFIVDLSEEEYELVEYGRKSIYLYGFLEYTSYVTLQKYKFDFMYKITRGFTGNYGTREFLASPLRIKN